MNNLILRFKCENCGLITESSILREWGDDREIFSISNHQDYNFIDIRYSADGHRVSELVYFKDRELDTHKCDNNEFGIKNFIGVRIE